MFFESCQHVTHCEKLKFKLRYFRDKARYRAENMETDIFLKPFVDDRDKNSKGSLVLYLNFL